MKLITAFIHHVRAAPVVEALADAGFRNISSQTVTGMLTPLSENEQAYSVDAGGLVISEVCLSLICDDSVVDTVTGIIRSVARIGHQVSGWVYVSPIEQALPIGGPVAQQTTT